MDTILTSPFSPPLQRTGKDEAIATVWGNLPFKSPKLIVGVSLTSPYESSFPRNTVILPAILDTGLNRVFEIDKRQLNEPVYNKAFVEHVKNTVIPLPLKDKSTLVRQYFYMPIQIWIHRYPYTHYNKRSWQPPFPLKVTDHMRVMVPNEETDPVWPPLPMLGLQALMFNNLNLLVRSRDKTFQIDRDDG